MEDAQKIRIGGIKFSEKLVQITVSSNSKMAPGETGTSNGPHHSPPIFHLLTTIAAQNINVTFLCHSQLIQPMETVFCVEEDDIGEVSKLLAAAHMTTEDISTIHSVGTLTLFPHRNELSLLGQILHFFGQNNFPVHSLSTSISAIALNTDYLLLDKIALKIQNIVSLPENHAPFRQGFKITQIQL